MNWTVPFVDLQQENAPLKEQALAVFSRVFDSGQYVDGEQTRELEAEFAAFVGTPHAAEVGCGTDALILSLRALHIGAGDEVIVPSLTFPATGLAVRAVGATPVFADIDNTLNLDPEAVEAAVTRRTRAIIAVHWAGLMADMDPLRDLCESRGMALIEDAAQAHGASYRGGRAGSVGDFGCFSLHATKTLGSLGNGGIVATHSKSGDASIRLLRNFGRVGRERFVREGRNSRLGELQAAFVRLKLARLEELNARRIQAGQRYTEALADWVYGPVIPDGRDHVYHLYSVRTHHRDRLWTGLREAGIEAVVHYRHPSHAQPVFREFATRPLPMTEQICSELLSLPLPHHEQQQQLVIDTVKQTLRRK
jgi:dTDP-3-amino-3,4,6-trideoxy-alpha-D-glucose transaminase